MKGWAAPEELLYPQILEALSAWTRANRPRHEVVRVVGERWSSRSHELRTSLTRNTVPFGFYEADSEQGRRLLRDHGIDPGRGCPRPSPTTGRSCTTRASSTWPKP